jgi:hypothetical protein
VERQDRPRRRPARQLLRLARQRRQPGPRRQRLTRSSPFFVAL